MRRDAVDLMAVRRTAMSRRAGVRTRASVGRKLTCQVVCNPTSIGKLDELIALLDLPPGPRILDVGCGKGELLLRIAERYDKGDSYGHGLDAVAVDISPYCIADLREKHHLRSSVP